MILRQARRRNGYPATAGRALHDPRHGEACIAALTGEGGAGGAVVNRAYQVGKYVTVQAGAVLTTTQSRFDTGALSGGYLGIPHHTDFDYTDGQSLMAECWAYVDSYPTATAALFSKGGNPGNQPNWCVLLQPSGVLTGIVGGASWSVAIGCDTATPVPLKTWVHVRLTIGSNTLRLFVDGVLSATASGTGAETDAQPLTIGGGSSYGTFPGTIDGVRLLRGGVYSTASFTPPSTAPTLTTDTTLLLNFESAVSGALLEGVRWSLVGSGVAVSGGQVRDYPTSLRFSGGYLTHPASTLFNLAGGDWTIKTVIRWDGGAACGLWGRRNNQAGHGAHGVILTDGRLCLSGVWNGAWRDPWLSTPTATVTPNVWTPVAWVRRGTTVTIVVNGAEAASGTLTAEPVDQPSLPFAVGAAASYGEGLFYGCMQDFVFLRGVGETPAELAQDTPYRDRVRRPPGIVTLMR